MPSYIFYNGRHHFRIFCISVWWFSDSITVRVSVSQEMSLFDVATLEQWQRFQPVSVLALDLADRAVLRVAGRNSNYGAFIDLNFRWAVNFVTTFSIPYIFLLVYLIWSIIVSLWQQQNIIKSAYFQEILVGFPPCNKESNIHNYPCKCLVATHNKWESKVFQWIKIEALLLVV